MYFAITELNVCDPVYILLVAGYEKQFISGHNSN